MNAEAAIDELAEMSARLRAVPDAIESSVPRMARAVDDYLRECSAAGIDPDGQPWPPTAIGRKAQITGTQRHVVAVGSKIFVRVKGHDAMHSTGTSRGSKERRLLPRGPVPPKLAARLRELVDANISEALGGNA